MNNIFLVAYISDGVMPKCAERPFIYFCIVLIAAFILLFSCIFIPDIEYHIWSHKEKKRRAKEDLARKELKQKLDIERANHNTSLLSQ